MGKLPSASELSRTDVQVFHKGKEKVEGAIDNAWPTEALSLFERAGKEPTENDGSHPLVVTGPGLVGTPPKVIKSWQMTTWTSASCRR